MNLNIWILVASEALPYLDPMTIITEKFRKKGRKNYRNSSKTQEIFGVFDVKGAAIDASASLREIPTFAALSAAQSFAPSPHIPTMTW